MGSHLAKLLVQNHVLQAFEPALIDELLTLPTRVEEDGMQIQENNIKMNYLLTLYLTL